jgi:DNA repair exonuclease SbcCD ATPase subunit/predicted phosphodiesterase
MITIFSDAHAHNFKKFAKILPNGLNSRLVDVFTVMEKINEYNKANKIKYTLYAGDLVHTFQYIENDVLNGLAEILENWYGQFIYIPGNHDVKAKVKYAKHSVASAVFDRLASENIQYLHENVIDIGVKIFGVGNRSNEEFLATKFESADILLAHQFIENSAVPGGLEVSKKLKDMYKLLIFGDVHKPELRGNVLIPGAPLQHNFNDEGQNRGFWTVDEALWKCEFHVLQSPKFISVQDIKDVQDDGNYYRVQGHVKKGAVVGANVLVQECMKQEFRESGLDISMSDEALVRGYIALNKRDDLKEEVLVAKGLELLKGCESQAVTPKDWEIVQVEVNNFISFIGRHVRKFEKGMYLVNGANGWGKTTMFEAIYWCLFGETTKGMAVEDVVNDTENKDCFVNVLMHNARGEIINVTRTRKHEQYGNDFWFTITQDVADVIVKRESVKETQKELNQVLGTTAGFFKNVNYFAQENFEFFSTVTDANQKDICKNLLQLDKFEQAENKARLVVKELLTKYEEMQKSLSVKEALLLQTKSTIESLEFQKGDWEIKRKEKLDTLQNLVAELTAEIKKLTANLEIVNLQIAKKIKKRQMIEDDRANVVLDTAPFDLKIKSLEEEEVKAREVSVLDDKIKHLLEKGKQQVQVHKVNTEKYELQTTALQTEMQQIDEKVSHVGQETSMCPECGQLLPIENKGALLIKYKNSLQMVTSRLDIVKAGVAEYNKKVTAEKEAMERELKEANDARKAAGDTRSIPDIQVEKINLKKDRDYYIQETQKDYKEMTATLNTQITELQKKSSDINSQLTAKKREEAMRGLDKDDLETSDNPYVQQLKDQGIVKENLEKEVAKIREDYNKLDEEDRLMKYWQKGFSNQGLVSYLLDQFARQFTEIINTVLLDIGNGKYSAVLVTQKKLRGSDEYREKFDFLITVHGKKRSYKALSGGQKARINLATVLTLIKLIMQYYKITFCPFNLLILDEMFKELDEVGVESVYNELEKLSQLCSINVVEHKLELKSFFENVIEVSWSEETGTVLN